MSNERDVDATLTVVEDDVTVEKSFAPDEFPVPAIRFRLVSAADDPVDVRLVDEIPASFPMESVGFHPHYESDNWTAYEDHRVEFSRTLDPGEELVTVYGVRLDDDDPADFVTEPTLVERSLPDAESLDAEDVDDVIGSEDNVVREVLSGERDSLPGLGGEAPAEHGNSDGDVDSDAGTSAGAADAGNDADTSAVGAVSSADNSPTPAPREVDDDLRPAVTPREAEGDATGADEALSESVGEAEATAVEADVEEDAIAVESDAGADVDDGTDTGIDTGDVAQRSLAAALAEEVRAGDADPDDLERLREALSPDRADSVSKSTDVRIRRLQSKVEDLVAYSGAMEEFLDENGTGSELIADLNRELDEVRSELDAIRGRVSGVEDTQDGVTDEVTALSDNVDAVAGRVDATADRIDDVADRAASNADRIDGVTADVANAEERVGSLDDEVGDVREDIASLDADVAALREDVDERVGALDRDVSRIRGEVTDLRETVEELEEFRGRLNSAFGGVGEE